MQAISAQPSTLSGPAPKALTAPNAPAASAEPQDQVQLSPAPAKRFHLSGMLPLGDFNAPQSDPGKLIAPTKVPIPGGKFVPQYAPTVVGTQNVYDPAGDCNGNFMSSKFQVNNNCYNYACDIATNSFAQPGRKHGILLDASMTADVVVHAAEKDGLIEVAEHAMTPAEMAEARKDLPPGHFVALMFSAPDASVEWPGDYHWARCDQNGSWSQKDGTDSVTNFDFAGQPMSDPAASNWTVNQGPVSASNPSDAVVGYQFHSIMYVPDGQVDII